MISLELAQKLRDAGLEWEPKAGDWYCFSKSLPGLVDDELLDYLNQRVKLFTEKYTYFPRLDQMLAEIEQRGWDWSMSKGLHGYECIVFKDYGLSFLDIADTPEQVAGLGLLWILQEGER